MKSKKPPKNLEGKLIKSENLFPVVGIGASAGGLDAFKALLKAIPEDSGMAYVLVQHLAPSHSSLLPEILQKVTRIPVLEISDEVKVEPNHIYVMPSNKIMIATNGVLLLSPRPEKGRNERNLPIDLFFASLAEVHQSHAIGVVLSGTATDGTVGLKAIKDNGGITFAQDEASAEYESMPTSAIQAGVVDFVLSPDKIPEKLLEVTKIINAPAALEEPQHLPDEEVFRQILAVLRIRKGADFTYYKQTTIRRRILRRMAINKNKEAADYLKFLRENKQEQDVLYQDFLIPVTSFFRDPGIFDHLSKTIFPQIEKSKAPGDIIRVWVAGCSTGEEAYSLAMLFREFFDEPASKGMEKRVQIFASDISEPAIEKARLGIYSKLELNGVTARRLNAFFTQSNGHFQVNRQVRDMCVFAYHNFLKDPPFGKMDLISCRNVLIYMEPYLQKKALTTFHYALNPKGFLLLGKSETSSGVPDLFSLAAKNDKIYTRKDVPGRFMHVVSQRSEQNFNQHDIKPKNEIMHADFQKMADEVLLNKYTPAGVVINENMDIVQYRGSTSNYLEQLAGKPSHNLLVLAKQGLAFELRNILHKAKKEKAPAKKENIPVKVNGSLLNISIEAIPLRTIEPHYLILFHDSKSIGDLPLSAGVVPAVKKSKPDEKDARIRQLEQELLETREDMRGITEDQEAANEELQSANEELLSGSEELQSLNEELETSKEELQSTNEELTVINHEMVSLNEQVAAERNYSESIVANIREPLLVLDKDLRVKTANNAFYKLFRISEKQTEGVRIFDLGNQQWDVPELHVLLEKIIPEQSVMSDFEVTHNFPFIGKLTLLLNARQVISKAHAEKLILLSIEDITQQKLRQLEAHRLLSSFQNLIMQTPAPICIFKGADMVLEVANESIFNIWGVEKDRLGKPFLEIKPEMKDQPFMGYLDDVFHRGLTHHGTEQPVYFILANGERKDYYFNFVYQPFREEDGAISGVMVFAMDVTEHVVGREQIRAFQERLTHDLEEKIKQRTRELKNANEKLVQSNEELSKMNKELEAFTYVSSHDLQEPLRKIQTFAGRILDTEQTLSEKGKTYFHLMRDAAHRMQRLIEDLLAFSRLATDERTMENTDLGTLIEEVKADFKEIIQEKNATLEIPESCDADVIVFQFRQLIANLISNALKFSRPGVPPHIVIRSHTVRGSSIKNQVFLPAKKYCHISFSDNGIGFEAEFKEKIFEVFQKLHSKDEYPGTGIGLATVKKIVDNHHGIITAKSKLNEGTTFDIYLPVTT